MKRHWSSTSEVCVVNREGVHFDGLTRAPLDQDWGCDLEQFLTDERYAAHLEQHFPPGTAAEVRAAVLEELARPESSPPAPTPGTADSTLPHSRGAPATTTGLPAGTSDESARALARLAARLGQLVDASVPEVEARGSLAWKTTRGDWSDPVYRSVTVGRVALTTRLELQDGIGGPVDVFCGFSAVVTGLEPPAVVRLSWNGGATLEVTVHGPPEVEAGVRALVGGATLNFVG